MIELKGLRVAGLYLLLKSKDSELDANMSELGEDIEAYLYDRLSIEEMEELQKLYEKSDRTLEVKI
ncbi:MAG TPA: hypothetical protein DCO79_03785 [Spirochaeta sp.]|nr:hypothetical protein [Spirochaeta sp.]